MAVNQNTFDKNSSYDVVVVGTGFASSLFLLRYLKSAPANVKVLVLERGKRYEHAWQLGHQEEFWKIRENTFVNHSPRKPWIHTPVFGGGSNCWWGCTPRMLPSDFKMKSLYGVGVDWPISYEELEPYYCDAEDVLAISGPSEETPFPRSRPYPQPPHRFSDPDKALHAANPGKFFVLPSARARVATKNRAACCATGVCTLCPADAKFTIMNELDYLYQDQRVTLLLDAPVVRVEYAGNIAKGVVFEREGKEEMASGELVVLGANALFNPHLLLRSGLTHPMLGKRLTEQMSVSVIFDLDKMQNFQGSSSLTGHGYMLYDGEHRRDYAACLMETSNIPDIRLERGKWRQRIQIKFIFDNLPEEKNVVELRSEDPRQPHVRYVSHSQYAVTAMDTLWDKLPTLMKGLPVEKIAGKIFNDTEAHILGTSLMGNDPATSVVDRNLRHHQVRNLLVLGGSSFPTISPANPTLTISALSLWAADRLK